MSRILKLSECETRGIWDYGCHGSFIYDSFLTEASRKVRRGGGSGGGIHKFHECITGIGTPARLSFAGRCLRGSK